MERAVPVHFLHPFSGKPVIPAALFTSPHLGTESMNGFRLMKINIDDDTFLAAFEKVKALADELVAEGNATHPTYFEMLFLMGMVIFRRGWGGLCDFGDRPGRQAGCHHSQWKIRQPV